MRIAVTTQFRQISGGLEIYLNNIIPELCARGFEIGLWYEAQAPAGVDLICRERDMTVYCVGEVGQASAIHSLSKWRPDLIFSHGAADPSWEAALPGVAPVVYFCHGYLGTCISGNKTWKFPQTMPCHRRFGWQCLAHYFPHRCGGLSPITMIEDYSIQGQRLKTLRRCATLVTASEHMRAEYLNHGFDEDRVVVTGLYVPTRRTALTEPPGSQDESLRLLFCGRMVWLKGGSLLLEAAPMAAERLGRNLKVTFLGNGAERSRYQYRSNALAPQHPKVRFEFTNWLSPEGCESAYRQADLLVVPSIWPEPFGMVGPEAARYGVPAAAFATGGIVDWLRDGINGHLAPSDPPTAAGLADAIVRCLSDPAHYRQLKVGAIAVADRVSLEHHLGTLLSIFESARSHAFAAV